MGTEPFSPPSQFNIADYFLDERIREGRGGRVALRTDAGSFTFADVAERANRYGTLLRAQGVRPEERVIIALHDGLDFVAALFGVLKIGAVVVMVNPYLRADAVAAFFGYTRARVALVESDVGDTFREAAADPSAGPEPPRLLFPAEGTFQREIEQADADLENYPTHRDDAAIWLFSGGTSGRPKAVVQTHRSYANSTERYGKRTLGLTEDDVTIAVPKLFFGYATGSNLFFPFSVGASSVLFPDRCTPEALLDQIARHRPTVLVNVPTMVRQLLEHTGAADRDLSSLRFATSAGEALPVELHRRWKETFGIELLDGLGTAEMWHIFISNRPGDVRPGTLGRAVDGFDVRVRDDDGRDLPDGEIGTLWVRGESRATAYWQNMEETRRAFRGEWYASEDMISRDADGYFTYHGRADDMLKVSGKWLAPGEVENRLLEHWAVREVCVVGIEDQGLVHPHAFVVLGEDGVEAEGLEAELIEFVVETLESYKAPRTITFLPDLPRTHLGKVDRGKLRAG